MPMRMNRVQCFKFCLDRLLSLAIGLSVVAQATGQPVYDKDAFKKLETAAKNGSPEAQCNVGFQYALGLGGTKGPDMKQAAFWYTKAAQQNFAPAQYRLGYCYLKGEGVRPDAVEAQKWYGLAASNGLAEAQYDFGVLLYESNRKDEAYNWFYRAAENGRGVAAAQWRLSESFVVQRKPVEEFRWAYIAARNGSPEATEKIAYWEKTATPERTKQLAEARELANEFFTRREKK